MIFYDVISASQHLDKVCPDWYKFVDIDLLNLNNSNQCLVGQILDKKYGVLTKDRIAASRRLLDIDCERNVFFENEHKEAWIKLIKTRLTNEIKIKLVIKEEIAVRKYVELPSKVYLDELPYFIDNLKKLIQ